MSDSPFSTRHGIVPLALLPKLATHALLATYVALRAHWNASTGRCDPSIATIAKAAGVSERSATRAVARLSTLGIVTGSRRDGWSTQYVFADVETPDTGVTPDKDVTPTPVSPTHDSGVAPPLTKCVETPDTGVTQTYRTDNRTDNRTDIDPDDRPGGAQISKNQLAWVTALRAATNLIADVKIRDLSLQQRYVLGRYFSWRFSNCTKSESRNKRAGAKAAIAFAKMADSKLYADLTVREYVDEAYVYHERFLDRGPFYDPFAIRAVAERGRTAVPDAQREAAEAWGGRSKYQRLSERQRRFAESIAERDGEPLPPRDLKRVQLERAADLAKSIAERHG